MPTTYTREPLWYKDAIIYELNIKGFRDSNGDGIGDFKGVLQKLDYLEDLGVTAIWLLPFYPSPLRDDGYDISDYYTISERYGNLDDFKRFLDEAHKRGLKVITELVINHTSDQHPWFQRARRAPKGSHERDFYVWTDDPEKYSDVRIIFTDTEPSNWTWDPVAKQHYWHRFFHHQPDLNYDNPAVRQGIFDILEYWLDMGVDGFRLDAIPYLYERDGTNGENLPETHAFIKELRAHVDAKYDNVLLLAEANMWPEDSASYFGDGDECHMNYHFPIMPRMYMAVKMEDRYPIIDILKQTPRIPDECQWAMFLRNHDELTLEMVTDEERDFMYRAFAQDPTARINVGIRRRLAPLMDNDRRRIELLNVLLLSMPGTPVLYYGDEIGMGDNYYLGDRDGVRTPMQWNSGENAGFSDANPQQLYLPVVRDPEYTYRSVNVERQQRNTNSLLWWTKRIIAKRQEFKVFGRGDIEFLYPDNAKVLAFVRRHEDEEVLVIVNLSRFSEAVRLDLSDYRGVVPQELFGESRFPQIEDGPYPVTLAPFGYYWLRLVRTQPAEPTADELERHLLTAASVEALFEKPASRVLCEEILPAYVGQISFFASYERNIERVNIHEAMHIVSDRRHYVWLILQVELKRGFAEWVQLPISIRVPHKTGQMRSIASADIDGERYELVDAFSDYRFRENLLRGFPEFEVPDMLRLEFGIEDHVEAATQSRVSSELSDQFVMVEYGDRYRIKFYRRIAVQPNPDFDLKRHLTAQGFEGSPPLLGYVHYRPDRRTDSTLAIIEPALEHQGDGYQYVKDTFKRLAEGILTNYEYCNPAAQPVDLLANIHADGFPDRLREGLNAVFLGRIAAIGRRTADMHRALAQVGTSRPEAFEAEPLSLHYQRSLYAGFTSLASRSFTTLRRSLDDLDTATRTEAEALLAREGQLMESLKAIYDHKIDATKIRTHGNYQLEQLFLVGDAFVIENFEGEPERPFSERKLRRSPVKDLAAMIRSFHYAATSVLLPYRAQLREEQFELLSTWLEAAYTYVSAHFLTAYRESVGEASFLPDSKDDLRVLLRTFIVEKALSELQHELLYRRDMVGVAVRGI